MAYGQKPPPFRFDPKNPTPPLDLEKIFREENINMKAILDSRKLTKDIDKTLAPYTGEFGDAQKKHLLKRTMVGYASRHLKDLEGLTMDEAVDKIMTFHEMGEPVNTYYVDLPPEAYKEKYGNEDVYPGEPFISRPYVERVSPTIDEASGNERWDAIYSWIYESIYSQPTSISWKLFIFLHNLTPVIDFGSHKKVYSYLRLVYEGSFRSYRQYIYDLTLEPLMLEYLNLALSRKETPDENYAREVQELFTVGKRPFSRYTEGDVQSAARVLVGWRYDYDKSARSEGWEPHVMFNDWNHDTGDKVFSEFYGNRIIRGREGQAGKEELDEFLDMIFETEEVAIYLSRRLFQFFVYPVLSDHIEENIIKPLAEVMRSNGYNLAETLKVLLKSEYFYSSELYNAIIKPPLDFTLALYKEFDILQGSLWAYDQELQEQFNSIFQEDRGYFNEKFYNSDYIKNNFFKSLSWRLNSQGMRIMEPPSVSGWPAFYQEPVYDLFWLNSVTIKEKKGVSEGISKYGLWVNDNVSLRPKLDSFLESFENPSSLDSFLDEVSDRFLGGPIPERAHERIKKSVLGEDLNENYWTQAVNNFLSNKSKDHYYTLFNRIEKFLSLVLELNEIHVH